jgi:hypothetical protein
MTSGTPCPYAMRFVNFQLIIVERSLHFSEKG